MVWKMFQLIKEFKDEWKYQMGWMKAFGAVFPWEKEYWKRMFNG